MVIFRKRVFTVAPVNSVTQSHEKISLKRNVDTRHNVSRKFPPVISRKSCPDGNVLIKQNV